MVKGQRFICFSEFRIPPSAFRLVFKAPVAQWIERQPPELKAAGSSPAGRTTIKTIGYDYFFDPLFVVYSYFSNPNFANFPL